MGWGYLTDQGDPPGIHDCSAGWMSYNWQALQCSAVWHSDHMLRSTPAVREAKLSEKSQQPGRCQHPSTVPDLPTAALPAGLSAASNHALITDNKQGWDTDSSTPLYQDSPAGEGWMHGPGKGSKERAERQGVSLTVPSSGLLFLTQACVALCMTHSNLSLE